ncbi:MAG: RNA-protein complex protein Nop10 [Candidatus Thermoplasmatota archaeon]|jgi:H/ACA ribonucleoprotein complex subunit 3|nr:RNA-protein complex protein Nop10 [Candidatus Thermoplasmatota archaeon]
MPAMRKCRTCLTYTFSESCPKCGNPTGTPHPARFSPHDPYGKYRRALLALDAPAPEKTPGPTSE